MSPDEAFVTFAAVLVGPILWTLWLFQMRHVQRLHRRSGVGAIGLTLVACAVLVFAVLETGASFDVVDDPKYLFMYIVVGLAWVRIIEMTFPFLGLSPRDDVVERTNRAAVPAVAGALIAVTLCYAGGNIGDGPGWWVVLPETRDPRDAPDSGAGDWILKPALGRVGEGVGMRGVIEMKEMRRIARAARWWPGAWIAQRRFQTVPIEIDTVRVFPCLGVYTLDGRAIGAYGRLAVRPLIDSRAMDAAVLAA